MCSPVFSCVINTITLRYYSSTNRMAQKQLPPHSKAKSQIILQTSRLHNIHRTMSRSKIVKEAGVKPTDFENTVAKVRFMLFEYRIVRENFARDVYICAEIFTPFILLRAKKWRGFSAGSKNGALKRFFSRAR